MNLSRNYNHNDVAARCLIICLIALSSIPAHAAPPTISSDALRLLILNKTPDLTIVDVRPPDAYAKSHIEGARNTPASTVQRAGLPRQNQIVVYCVEAECPLSSGAANSLIADGYPRVELLSGGFTEWIKKGYPVQTAANTVVTELKHPRSEVKDAQIEIKAGTLLPVDVRPASEFSAGHLPHARSVPLEQLDADILRLPKDIQILVYDRIPGRSHQALAKLMAAGFKATELSGGLIAWVKMKYPLETK
jgi:rhodanese-related sulfurtransferase